MELDVIIIIIIAIFIIAIFITGIMMKIASYLDYARSSELQDPSHGIVMGASSAFQLLTETLSSIRRMHTYRRDDRRMMK
jgi:hypothetical protein